MSFNSGYHYESNSDAFCALLSQLDGCHSALELFFSSSSNGENCQENDGTLLFKKKKRKNVFKTFSNT